MHAYSPDRGRNAGPGACSVPGCDCKEYVRPLSSLRRQRWLLLAGVKDPYITINNAGVILTVIRDGDDTAEARKIDDLITRIEARRLEKRKCSRSS